MMLMERKFTWVLEKFSSSQDEIRYSPHFRLAGCNWRLVAYPERDGNNNRYLSLYLELDLGSLPQGWCRDVEYSITLVNKGWRRWNKVWEETGCFSAESNVWGFNQFLPFFRLRGANEEFLVDDRLIIIAKVRVLPEETVMVIEPLSSEEGNLAADASVGKSLGDLASCHVAQKDENVASEEGSDDNDATDKGLNDHDKSEEGSDVSEEGLDDEDDDASVNKSRGDYSCQMKQRTENAYKENLMVYDTSQEGSYDDDDNGTSEEGSDDDEALEESLDDDDASEESSDDDDSSEQVLDDEDDDASVNKSQGESSCQMKQKTGNAYKENLEDDDASEEGSEDDDGASEEGSDDEEALKESSDDDEALKESSNDDDASKESSDDVDSSEEGSDDDDDDASSLVSSVSDKDVSSLNKLNSIEAASQKVENGDTRCNNVGSVTEASTNFLEETINFNGFQVLSSEVELVSHIFKRHPDIALGFRPKNQQIRRAYVNELRSLIEMLCQSPEKLSKDDLSNADDTLVDLIDVGFKLDWLKTKLNEVSEKKKKEQDSMAWIQTKEEQLKNLKLMFVDLESRLEKEKAEALAATGPLSFNDVIC